MYVSCLLNAPRSPGGKWWVECEDENGQPFAMEFDDPVQAIEFMEKARAEITHKLLREAGIKIFDGKVIERRKSPRKKAAGENEAAE